MPQVINTNIASLNAQRNLSKSGSALNVSLQRLSTGLRINSAKDDAAGLAISERMSGQIRGLNQAVRNANDGVSLAQSSEGALQTVGDSLLRMRELSIQSANSTNSASDRTALQAEVNQLLAEVNRIGSTTEFNGQKLFDGNFSGKTFQIGANAGQTISVSLAEVSTTALGSYSVTAQNNTADQGTGGTTNPATGVTTTTNNTVAAQTLTFTGSFGSTTAGVAANATAEEIATAINNVTATTGVKATATTTATIDTLSANGTVSIDLGTNSMTSAVTISATVTTTDLGQLVTQINNASGQTNITAALGATNGQIILTQADGENITIDNFNDGTTATPTIVVNGADGGNETLTDGGTDGIVIAGTVTLKSDQAFSVSSSVANSAGSIFNVGANVSTSATQTQLSTVDVSTQTGANNAIDVIDAALDRVNSIRADLGALQNRFETAIQNLQSQSENLSAARSRVRDADFAAETANLTKMQILQQAGISILSQANALPQNALALLQ